MSTTIFPSGINGTIVAPPGKSSMQRACIAALLHIGTTTIYNAGNSNDEKAVVDIIKHLGADVHVESANIITINSNGIRPDTDIINCGESGLAIRMIAPVAALCNNSITLTGSGSLLKRPMQFFDNHFADLGVKTISNDGYLPVKLQGPLIAKDIVVDGSLSSQFISGLLMAYSVSNNDATITVHNLTSKPYIDLTIDVLKKFGLRTPVNNNYTNFSFKGSAQQQAHHINYTVEGDWSNAAFLLVAGAIAGTVTIKGLYVNSSQADKQILHALELSGCNPQISEENITVTSCPLYEFEFDATNCPDLFPPLVALASYCKGTTILHGAHRLQYKESNRSTALQQEFAKMGIAINIEDNSMYITGRQAKGATVYSHNDHRIAMACAVAALGAYGATTILNEAAVQKSYPAFFEDLAQLQYKG